jgi:hypothetical protein
MQGNRGPTGGPQARGNANQRENAPDEGFVGQATEAVRNVAESASDLARDTHDTGAVRS